MKRFAVEEVVIVKEMVRLGRPSLEIATKLNRSRSSVGNVLSRLGLTRPKGTNQYSFDKNAINGMQGKEHNDETKRKIAETRKKYTMDCHPSWKGGRRENHNGYICLRLPDHPGAVNGYVFEHRLIMESILKRYLDREEVVHHINEITTDNEPKNLMLFKTDADHRRYHEFMRMEMEIHA